MISVIRTDSGGFNIIGTADGVYSISGHLTEKELQELIREAQKALKK